MSRGGSVRAPVWIVPGHAADAVTVHLGHGRARAGRVGNGSGFNAYALRTSAAPWFARGSILRATTEQHPLACTQHHQAMEGREPVRVAALEQYAGDRRRTRERPRPAGTPMRRCIRRSSTRVTRGA